MTTSVMSPGLEVPQFVFLKSQPKTPFQFPGATQKTRCGGPIKNNFCKPVHQPFLEYHNHYRAGFQASNNRSHGNKLISKSSYSPSHFNFENHPNFHKYAKGNSLKHSGSKNYYGSTASESDGSTSHTSSELSGFKIVHRGKVIHDETEEDEFEPAGEDFGVNCHIECENGKFAASCLVIGPNAGEISLPTFM